MSVEQGASAAETILAARERYVARGVATPTLVVDRAEGARVWDVDGREFLDFAGGIACQNLGHGPSAVVAAIHEQVDRYLHQCFMVGTYEPYVELCRRLDELWPGESDTKSILVNSGAEAIENAVKIARAATGRDGVVVFDRAFHGRTNLTMAMTSKLVYKQGFGPFAGEVYRAPVSYPFRDGLSGAEAAARAIDVIDKQVGATNVACIVIEPVLGEGGFIVPSSGFLPALSEYAAANGIVFVADEIQSGMCRTGAWFASEHEGVVPDLVTVAKGVAGGLPLAGVVGRAEIMDAVHPGGLGGTYGGNPVACAAALGAIATMKELDLNARAREIEALLLGRLRHLAAAFPSIGEVRGRGAMIAIEIVEPGTTTPDPAMAARLSAGCHQAGVLTLTCGTYGNVLRFVPPLVAPDHLLHEAMDVLAEVASI